MKLRQIEFILQLVMWVVSSLARDMDNFSDDISYMVESLNNEEKSNRALHCSYLVLIDGSSNNSFANPENKNRFISQYKEKQKPVFLSTNLSDQRLSKVVSQKVGCLTTILETDDFDAEKLAKMTMKMWDHSIFKIGGMRPSTNELKVSDRLFVWIESKDLTQNVQHIHLFCPKENQFNGHKFSLKMVQKQNTQSNKMRITCPSRLTGQDLTLAYSVKSKVVDVDGVRHSAGVNGYLFLYLAEMFNFSLTLEQMNFHIRGTWTKYFKNVKQGKVIGLGQFEARYKRVEVLKPHIFRHYHFVARSPREVATYTSIIKPFPPLVWVAIGVTLILLLITFYATHFIYSSSYIKYQKLHKSETSLAYFVIGVYFKMTEPEAVDWFSDRWSTGRLLSILYGIFCFFIVAFYNCNLRVHLAAIAYEDPIDTNQDVVKNGKRVWIMIERHQLENKNATYLPVYPVAVLADEQNSFYSFTRSRGFPISSLKDMITNGSVALLEKDYVKQTLRLSPKYRDALEGNTLYVSKDSVYYSAGTFITKKYNPVREELNLGVIWAQECGLVIKWSHQGLPAEAFMEPRLPLIHETAKMSMEQLLLALGIYGVVLVTAASAFAKEMGQEAFRTYHKKKCSNFAQIFDFRST